MRSVVLRAAASIAWVLAGQQASATDDAAFQVEARIDMPGVAGRIDHLAYDAEHRRLFVAELGNGSVDVVDIAAHVVAHRIGELHEPQGIAWSPKLGRVYVAGGDGTVKAFSGADYSLVASARLGNDADNLRFDPGADRLYVGYGEGAIAVLDATTLARLGEIGLKAHPESFQLAADGRLFANVPGAQEVAVADRALLRQSGSWSVGDARANYPLALDASNGRVLVVFRRPASITSYRMKDGKVLGKAPACADADDLFVDARRQHVYVICGDGSVDVLDAALTRIARFRTVAGARTGLYSPEADRLFVAVRALGDLPAAVWILAPAQPGT
jgi:DNA-binding beta-propeller fold protein YncE